MWDDRGRATARAARVQLEEAEEAANAPPGLRWEQRLDDLVMIIGMAASGRVILVVGEPVHRTTVVRIVGVRAIVGRELDEWRRRVL